MPTLAQVFARVEALGVKSFFGFKREIKKLPEILASDEEILGFCNGMLGDKLGVLVCTERRVIALDVNLLFGFTQIDVPIQKVTGVEHKKGIVTGEIRIAGGVSAVHIKSVPSDLVAGFVAAVNSAIEGHGAVKEAAAPRPSEAVVSPPVQVRTSTQPMPISSDAITQLERLGTLKEKGLLSEEEFQQQKKVLLGLP